MDGYDEFLLNGAEKHIQEIYGEEPDEEEIDFPPFDWMGNDLSEDEEYYIFKNDCHVDLVVDEELINYLNETTGLAIKHYEQVVDYLKTHNNWLYREYPFSEQSDLFDLKRL